MPVGDPVPDWRKPASEMTNMELFAAFEDAGRAFDDSQADDEGHGGSPGERAYERCNELETEITRRGLPMPSSN